MGNLERIKRIMGRLLPKPEEPKDIPDDETRDKVLRSLRRQRRTQMEEQEKIYLRKQIGAYQQERDKAMYFGVGQKKMLNSDNAFKPERKRVRVRNILTSK